MTEAHHISHVCGNPDGAVLDVIFVHGLTGDPKDTWVSGPQKGYWPSWLCADLQNVSIYTIGYPASLFEKWAKKETNLHECADNILEHLAAYGFGKRPIAFISHSLGGILVKEILRVSKQCTDEDWQLIAKQTRLAAFLATPHTGASLASAIKLIAPRMSSKVIDLLSNDSGYLTSLNLAYRDLVSSAPVATVSYYEKYKTKDVAIVVTPESADPGVPGTHPIAVDADHLSICKPDDKNALVYISILRHLKKVFALCTTSSQSGLSPAFGADDYLTKSASDRRDLMQKLMDAGREHTYQMANDYQNKFAQKYYQLGLFTEAKQQSDSLLASVQQRFDTHVYSAKICKKAHDDEIAVALQQHVIDALCNGVEPKPSPTAILQALYFLTEQCHIRWDAP
jgi:hypothetical protein